VTDRPAILTARLQRLAEVRECAERLRQSSRSDRPVIGTRPDGSGGREAIHADDRTVALRTADAVKDVRAAGGSVAAVQQVTCPCERLGASNCEVTQ
jgi:hypothetical protein